MREDTPKIDDISKGIILLKNFADSLIKFIDAPTAKIDDLIDVNDRVREFFKLIDETNSIDLNAKEASQLYSIVDTFHKTLTNKDAKIKGKMIVADAGTVAINQARLRLSLCEPLIRELHNHNSASH